MEQEIKTTRGLMQVVIDDPSLEHYNYYFKKRYDMYLKKKAELESAEGSLANFALGYEIYGIHRTSAGTIYKEWAPGATSLSLVIST